MKTVVAVLAAVLLALLPGASAQAGPDQREDTVVQEVAVLAETMHHYQDQGRKYPRTMNNKRAKRDLGHEMAPGTKIVKYQRLNGGRDYRICVVHRKGGWATWSTRTTDIRSSGKGRACRF